jgi:hypothetical protein
MVFGCKLKLGCTFRYCVLGGFSEPSVCPFGGVLRGSCAWACGTSRSVTPDSCFMILLPGGRLFIRDNQSTRGSLVDVILVGLGWRNRSETEKNRTVCSLPSSS